MDAVISIMQVFCPQSPLRCYGHLYSWVVKSIHNLIRALLGKKTHAALIQLLLDKGSENTKRIPCYYYPPPLVIGRMDGAVSP